MKPIPLLIGTIMCAALACETAARAGQRQKEDGEEQGTRTVVVDPNVTVTACAGSGAIVVRGWDRNEVRARSGDAERIDLRRMDGTSDQKPATQLRVIIYNVGGAGSGCEAYNDIELNVPRGATVKLKTRSGDLQITDVAGATVESISGDVALQRIARVTEAASGTGDVTLKSAGGRVRLRTISGSIDAADVKPVEAGDAFIAQSTSGDVTLDRVGHARVDVNTLSGTIRLTGPLARGGRYDLKTNSGDVVLKLPDDASFQVTAKVSVSGEIVTDFPLKLVDTSSAVVSHSLTGTYGTGDATINVASFSGTVRLRRDRK